MLSRTMEVMERRRYVLCRFTTYMHIYTVCVHMRMCIYTCDYARFRLYRTIPMQIAELIRAGKAASVTGQVPNPAIHELSLESWRIRIRQAWLLGFLDRNMSLGKGQNLVGHMVFNTFTINEVGMAFLEDPRSVSLPTVQSGKT